MSAEAPTVSVLMAVRNGEDHLREAVDSVLSQSYRDFEFLVLDDGSEDATPSILAGYRDARIRLVDMGGARGLVAALNAGLDAARGRFLARMDADDVALPERFARQVEFLDSTPEVGVCGSWYQTLGAPAERVVRAPMEHAALVEAMLHKGNPLAHPTVMVRRACLGDLRYEAEYRHAEDYRLWTLLSRRARLAVLPEVLLRYREHAGQVSARHPGEMQRVSRRIRAEMALQPDDAVLGEEREAFLAMFRREGVFTVPQATLAARVIDRLVEANAREPHFAAPRYARLLGRSWVVSCCQRSPSPWTGLGHLLLRSPRRVRPGVRRWLRWLWKGLAAC